MSSWFTLLSTALGRTPLLPKNEFSASSTINIEMAQENIRGVTYAFNDILATESLCHPAKYLTDVAN